ncbi:MAG: toast rack family protein [Anaerolineales bacterium]|nr:toast rack family protein [Anaerolineales bacterium]
MTRNVLLTLLLVSLVMSACSSRINSTDRPTQTDEITLPIPSGVEKATLVLVFSTGTLKLRSDGDSLISGTATYNVPDFKPQVTFEEGNVRIEQGAWNPGYFPDIRQLKNEWEFRLGNFPIDLQIEAGAYKAEYELGGLSLMNLTVQDGASEVKLNFARPNQVEMALFRYQTGASNVTLSGLGNANFTALDFNSGAGNYILDFSGEWKRSASVNIETGVSNLTLVIPKGMAAQVTVAGAVANVAFPSHWTQQANVYTQTGEGPLLTILVEIGAGNVTISH